jgi:hypothetical protein
MPFEDAADALAVVGTAFSVPVPPAVDRQWPGQTTTFLFTGRSRFGIDQWACVPFEVPAGVRRITVAADYQRFTVAAGIAGNVLDLGIFGPAGWGPDAPAGFRGWSGGARTEFTLSAADATPGYLPGPIDEGTWAVALGPVVLNPFGMRWSLRIDLEHGEAPATAVVLPPPAEVSGRGRAWYRGDLHLHTVHSDGRRTPGQLARAARTAGLDFVASTEHNTNAANLAWGAEYLDELLVIPGEEVTTRHGHWLAIGLAAGDWVDWRYGPRDGLFGRYAARVRAAGGLVVAAHPALPLPSGAWEFGYRHVDAIEVWNGRWTLDDEVALVVWDRLLRRGRRIAAVAGSDSHADTEPVGRPQVAVHADRLSSAAIVEGLVRGRSYLAESAEVGLVVTAGSGQATAGPGDDIAVPAGTGTEIVATVAGAPRSSMTIRTAAGVVAATPTDVDGTGELRWHATDASARYARVEVRRPRTRWDMRGAMVAMSNPIWLHP